MANLLDKASILLTPTAYNNGSMLSIKPTNGDGDFTFLRNGDASRVNSSGNIVTEGANLPRINYENGCGSWLLEPQSTNLVTYSEDFSDASWQKNSTLIVTTNNAISPDGTQNAARVNKVGSGSRLGIEIPITSGQSYTLSFYMKNNGGNTSLETSFDGQSANQSYTITDNWERYEFTFIATATETSQIRLFQSAVNIDAHIWGAQLEQQSYATSYIPTSGATSTRIQDIANGSGNSTLINSTEGVLYAEIAALANSVPTQRLALSSGNNTNRIYLQFSTTLNRIFVSVVSSSSIVVEIGHTLSNITNFNKIAVKYKQDDFALWINGVEVATDTSGATPLGLSELAFDDGNGSLPFYGKTKALAVFPYLTDAELQSLTTI